MLAATTRCVRQGWNERVMKRAPYAHPSCFMLIPSLQIFVM